MIGRRLISIWRFIQTMPPIPKINRISNSRNANPFENRYIGVSKEKLLIANIEKNGMVVYEQGKTLRKAK
jgi:hypothetical protein